MRRRSIGSVFAKAVTCAVALLAAGIPAALGDDLPRTALAARAEVRGEMPEAQALFLKGQAFEKEGRDAEAVKIYKDAVKRYPEMLAAINGLAYLQATSKDETVR